MSSLKVVRNECLTYAVNFGIGSAFSKVPGSAFLKAWVRVQVRFIKYVQSY